MTKCYFREDDPEMCCTIDVHLDHMAMNRIEKMEVFEAKIERGTGYFYCLKHSEIGEVGESCGKLCKAYDPRNRKSGICKHYGHVYEQTDKSKTLKL